MKKFYENPTIEIIELSVEDIITTSSNNSSWENPSTGSQTDVKWWGAK